MAGGDKTVNIPGLGKTNKVTVYVAVAAGVFALGYAWYKHNKSSSSVAANPATGTAAASSANSYGYGAYGYGGYTYSPNSYGYGYAALENALTGEEAYAYGYSAATGAGESGTGAPTTNAQWSQNAVTQLTAQGTNGATVQAALGVYLTGGQLTAAQQTVVQEAIAVEGYPPTAGAGGYPPAMNTASSTGQTGTTSATNVTIANVVGMDAAQAQQVLISQGLKPEITFTAAANKPGIYHIITKTSPAVGASVAPGTTVILYYKTSSTQ